MPVKFSQKQLIIIGGAIALVIIIFVVLALNLRPKANTQTAVTLTVWGIEDQNTFASMIGTYPYAKVTYLQVDPSTFSAQLLSALAAGTGPDVFEISNRDLPKWKSVLAPMPTSSTAFGMLQLSQLFPDVVAQDFVSDGAIYGLPLSIDTMVMVYNKDLFNSAGIALPPKTWNDFDADIASLRQLNAQGQLVQAAAAIGGSTASVTNAPDLLALLMLQNGTEMTNPLRSGATFAAQAEGGPGLAAFNFYLQFANAASPYYTWNDGMGDALTSFVNGKTAIMFAYQSDLAKIKAKAPFLDVGIAPMPQAQGASVSVNYPRYQGFVAAKAGKWPDALNFIIYLTTTSGDGKLYQAATGRPPALRADIQSDIADPNLSVFASQALTAKSWYEADSAQTDILLDMAIKNVLAGAEDPTRALKEAETAVSQLMGRIK